MVEKKGNTGYNLCCRKSDCMSYYARFGLYHKDGKKGVVDNKTKKVVLHHSYGAVCIKDNDIILKDGTKISFKDVLKKVNFLASKYRFIIVEETNSKKIGIFDNKKNVMILPCEYDSVEYLDDDSGFKIIKNGKNKNVSYEKLSKIEYDRKKPGVILVNNLSIYFSKPFYIQLKNGQKINFDR